MVEKLPQLRGLINHHFFWLLSPAVQSYHSHPWTETELIWAPISPSHWISLCSPKGSGKRETQSWVSSAYRYFTLGLLINLLRSLICMLNVMDNNTGLCSALHWRTFRTNEQFVIPPFQTAQKERMNSCHSNAIYTSEVLQTCHWNLMIKNNGGGRQV